MPVFLVKLPQGVAEVTLDRRGLGLGDRGGFDARWADADEGLELESFREAVREHLAASYEGPGAPPGVLATLASHQLADDLLGWARLNSPPGANEGAHKTVGRG